jgi:hypothetical protein
MNKNKIMFERELDIIRDKLSDEIRGMSHAEEIAWMHKQAELTWQEYHAQKAMLASKHSPTVARV